MGRGYNSTCNNAFQERFKHSTETDKLWMHQLTALNGDKWKDARATFSPVFASGKLKGRGKSKLHMDG